MKLFTPEVSWHETLPVYSCDIQPYSTEDAPEWTRLATAGGDKIIRLWKLYILDDFQFNESTTEQHFTQNEFLSSLQRHEKNVNVVRWSPSGDLLASGSDDSLIFLWKKSDVQNLPPSDKNIFADEEEGNQEIWNPHKTLRRHLEDVYDICWSSDGRHLVSGSVDQCVIQWRLSTGQALILKDHRQYVQGVAWDPLDHYVVSLGSDRSCRVYRVGSRNCSLNVIKIDKMRLFQDDSWKAFFRRLQFSPDGHLLICPSGCLEASYLRSTVSTKREEEKELGIELQVFHAAHIFHRSNLGRPVVSVNTYNRPVIAVRFCPIKFQLKESSKNEPVFTLPYRWVFVLVLEDGLLFHDTQHKYPFLQISSIHYQALNDAAWSPNGRILVVTSTDGYCSIIRFNKDELGVPHTSAMTPYVAKMNKKLSVHQSNNKEKSDLIKLDTDHDNNIRSQSNNCANTERRQQSKDAVSSLKSSNEETDGQISSISSNLEGSLSKPKRRVPLITLDHSTPVSSPLRDSASPFQDKVSPTVHCSNQGKSKKDSPAVGELTSGKRRLPLSQLKTILEFDVGNEDDSNQENKIEQENDQKVIEPLAKKRRVSFTTLSPEVRIYCPSGTAEDVSSPQPK